jgi:nucleotide-binding universal stress UspA family protein
MFQSCLICTDFTDGLQRLSHFVPSLSSGGFQSIIFCHSVPFSAEGQIPKVDEEKIAARKAYLSQALTDVPKGKEIEIEVRSGRPLDILPRILEDNPVDVILMGTPVRSLLQEQVFGSTLKGILQLTKTPVTIVRPQLLMTYTQEELALRCQHLWRSLLIPYNDSGEAHYLLEQIKQKACRQQENAPKQLILCWVVEASGRSIEVAESQYQQARDKLELLGQELRQLGFMVEAIVRKGNPVQEVLSVAAEYHVSSIALCSKTKSNWLQQTVFHFASDLLRQSWFPVLLFPFSEK